MGKNVPYRGTRLPRLATLLHKKGILEDRVILNFWATAAM